MNGNRSVAGAWRCVSRCCFLLAAGLAAATSAAHAVEMSAKQLLPRSRAEGGRTYLINPSGEQMVHRNGRPAGAVMLFFPEAAGQAVTVTMPVPRDGYYRVVGTHVFGAWKQGRYGLYRLTVGGVPMPGRFHGWYHAAGPPSHWPRARTHLTDVNWGIIYLRPPSVELTFRAELDGLLGTERLALEPVPVQALKPADRERRVPERAPTGAVGAARGDEEVSRCTVRDAGPLEWVIPAPMAEIRLDGDLSDWDLSRPAVVADAETIDRVGWKSPPPEGDEDLSMVAQLAWDADNLYLAAKVTDDEVIRTRDRRQASYGHMSDGIVVMVNPPAWITSGPRAKGPVADELRFGMNYYVSGAPQRAQDELQGGWDYVAMRTEAGYQIEGAISFDALRFRPAAGDRIPFLLILVDRDPQKPPQLQFDQYGLPTRGFGRRHRAQLRLLGPGGWGADFSLEKDVVLSGGMVRFLGTIDVVRGPVKVAGVEVVRLPSGETVAGVESPRSLAVGHRYLVEGAVRLPGLPPGRYELRPVIGKAR